jgi:hypothetical protein
MKPGGRAHIIIQSAIGLNGSRGIASTRRKVQPISICRILKSPLGDCLGINGLNREQRGERAERQGNSFFHTLIPDVVRVAYNSIFRIKENLKKNRPEDKKNQKIKINKSLSQNKRIFKVMPVSV